MSEDNGTEKLIESTEPKQIVITMYPDGRTEMHSPFNADFTALTLEKMKLKVLMETLQPQRHVTLPGQFMRGIRGLKK